MNKQEIKERVLNLLGNGEGQLVLETDEYYQYTDKNLFVGFTDEGVETMARVHGALKKETDVIPFDEIIGILNMEQYHDSHMLQMLGIL